MKKQLFVLGLAVAALASCTNEEVTDIADSNVIGFKTFVGNATKAVTGVDNNTLQNFYVYGLKDSAPLFTNEKVYKNGTAWGYDNIEKWVAATYNFAAYSNGGTEGIEGKIDNANVSYDATDGLEIKDYVVGTDNRDLVASISSTNINSTNQPVEFTFNHTLAKVKFTVQSSMGTNGIAISDLSVTGVKDKATLTYTSAGGASWTTPSDTRTISGATGTTTTDAPYSDEFVVIPQKNAITIAFKAAITFDDEAINKNLSATIDAENCDWKAGMCYNYVATIDATDMDIITFTLEKVTPWPDYTDTPTGDLSSQDAN